MRIVDHHASGLRWAPYICRGCGTSITTPNSFKKCPVCGIKFG
jgi:rubrerythrin